MFLKEMKKSGYTILHLILEFSNKEPKDCAKNQSLQLIMVDCNCFQRKFVKVVFVKVTQIFLLNVGPN